MPQLKQSESKSEKSLCLLFTCSIKQPTILLLTKDKRLLFIQRRDGLGVGDLGDATYWLI